MTKELEIIHPTESVCTIYYGTRKRNGYNENKIKNLIKITNEIKSNIKINIKSEFNNNIRPYTFSSKIIIFIFNLFQFLGLISAINVLYYRNLIFECILQDNIYNNNNNKLIEIKILNIINFFKNFLLIHFNIKKISLLYLWLFIIGYTVFILWFCSCDLYIEESITALRGIGIQTTREKIGSIFKLIGIKNKKSIFIPIENLQDLYINEGFIGLTVRHYMVAVPNDARKLVIVFEKTKPRRDILELTWHLTRTCLYRDHNERVYL